MRSLSVFCIGLLAFYLLSACSVQKRRYSKGYYISVLKKPAQPLAGRRLPTQTDALVKTAESQVITQRARVENPTVQPITKNEIALEKMPGMTAKRSLPTMSPRFQNRSVVKFRTIKMHPARSQINKESVENFVLLIIALGCFLTGWILLEMGNPLGLVFVALGLLAVLYLLIKGFINFITWLQTASPGEIVLTILLNVAWVLLLYNLN